VNRLAPARPALYRGKPERDGKQKSRRVRPGGERMPRVSLLRNLIPRAPILFLVEVALRPKRDQTNDAPNNCQQKEEANQLVHGGIKKADLWILARSTQTKTPEHCCPGAHLTITTRRTIPRVSHFTKEGEHPSSFLPPWRYGLHTFGWFSS